MNGWMDDWMDDVSYATWLFGVTGLSVSEGTRKDRKRTSDVLFFYVLPECLIILRKVGHTCRNIQQSKPRLSVMNSVQPLRIMQAIYT